MTLNSQGIIQEVRQEFEVILSYVTGEEAQQARADEIKRGLLRRLLGLGGRLLLLFFIQRAATYPRTGQTSTQGEAIPYQGQRTRHYFSIFGKLAVPRPYFLSGGGGRRESAGWRVQSGSRLLFRTPAGHGGRVSCLYDV